jgi:hypothetical protein
MEFRFRTGHGLMHRVRAKVNAPIRPSRLRVRPVRRFVRLIYFFAGRNLSRLQKGFDEFAFAANGQAGELLEPFSLRHFGIGVQPLCEQDNLFVGNASLAQSR